MALLIKNNLCCLSRSFSGACYGRHFGDFSKTSNTKWWLKKREIIVQHPRNKVPGGLIAVYKPKGMTSQDVCSWIKQILQPYAGESRPIKVGHGGTLDPMAEGVLVVGVREGCKGMDSYLKGNKSYRATALLGWETDTLDAEGEPSEHVSSDHITVAMLNNALCHFRGDIMQVPPMYSALKYKGKRMHEYAREGVEVEREPRPTQVFNLELVPPLDRLPEFSLTVTSGGGFYVRTLICDLARSCGGAAHMTALVRTRQGPFTLENCVPKEKWAFNNICDAIYDHSKLAGFDVVHPSIPYVKDNI